MENTVYMHGVGEVSVDAPSIIPNFTIGDEARLWMLGKGFDPEYETVSIPIDEE